MHINPIGNGNGPNGPGGITPPFDSNPERGNFNNKISHIIQNLLNDLRENGYLDSTKQASVSTLPRTVSQSDPLEPKPQSDAKPEELTNQIALKVIKQEGLLISPNNDDDFGEEVNAEATSENIEGKTIQTDLEAQNNLQEISQGQETEQTGALTEEKKVKESKVVASESKVVAEESYTIIIEGKTVEFEAEVVEKTMAEIAPAAIEATGQIIETQLDKIHKRANLDIPITRAEINELVGQKIAQIKGIPTADHLINGANAVLRELHSAGKICRNNVPISIKEFNELLSDVEKDVRIFYNDKFHPLLINQLKSEKQKFDEVNTKKEEREKVTENNSNQEMQKTNERPFIFTKSTLKEDVSIKIFLQVTRNLEYVAKRIRDDKDKKSRDLDARILTDEIEKYSLLLSILHEGVLKTAIIIDICQQSILKGDISSFFQRFLKPFDLNS